MAMSLIADEEDYENSDAEQVVALSQTYGSLELRKRDAMGCLQLLFVCVTEVHVIRELSELSEMFMVTADNYI